MPRGGGAHGLGRVPGEREVAMAETVELRPICSGGHVQVTVSDGKDVRTVVMMREDLLAPAPTLKAIAQDELRAKLAAELPKVAAVDTWARTGDRKVLTVEAQLLSAVTAVAPK